MKRIIAREKGQYFFFFFLLLLVFSILYFLPRITIPIGVAYVSYLLLRPGVSWLERRGVSHFWGTWIIFAILFSMIIYPIVVFLPFIEKEFLLIKDFLPRGEEIILKKYALLRELIYQKTSFDLGDKFVQNSMNFLTEYSKEQALKLPSYLASILEWLFVTPIFLFFFLSQGRNFKFLFLKLVPNSIFERGYFLFYQFNKQLGDYILAKILEALIIGLMTFLGLYFLGVPFAFLLGVFAGVTNIIPYIGPILAMAGGLILIFAEFGIGPFFLSTLFVFIVANVVDVVLVFPILVSKIVNLHLIVVIVSVILGSQFFGIVGMIISIPIAAAIRLLFQEIFNEFYSLDAK